MAGIDICKETDTERFKAFACHSCNIAAEITGC